MLKVAFQMNDILQINIKGDTTFALLVESLKLGHEVYCYHPSDLTIKNNQILAKAKRIIKAQYAENEHVELGEDSLLDLSQMNIVWLRQDSPFDLAYITSTYILEMLPKNILVLNNPKEVRDNPEKS